MLLAVSLKAAKTVRPANAARDCKGAVGWEAWRSGESTKAGLCTYLDISAAVSGILAVVTECGGWFSAGAGCEAQEETEVYRECQQSASEGGYDELAVL
jgi:hypothetical protein